MNRRRDNHGLSLLATLVEKRARWEEFLDERLLTEKQRMTQRFWSKVVKSEGCWPWRGSLSTTRYGRFGFAGKTFMAHRVAYELTFGTLPPGMLVCHHCDNPPCVKPEHLFAGTVTDNAADMVAKDRSSKGTRNHKAKLSAEDVVEIRATYAQGGVRQVDLAAHFGVTQSQISAILRGASWVR